MKEKQDPLNELYRKILHGTAHQVEKERLARWMAGLNVDREEISPEELATEREQSQRELQARFFHQRRKTAFIRPLMIAASIAAVMISTLVFFKMRPDQLSRQAVPVAYAGISTKPGEHKVMTLADGSKIWMNSATNVRYPVSFNGKTREVFLDGQAYFEISHDKKRPFIVHTGKLAVQVLGTTFHVRNYRDDAEASVIVASGKVAVKTPATDQSKMLTRGDQLVYNKKTGIEDQRTVNPADYIAWQNGAQVFRNKELREISRLLERSYGVTIHIKTPALEAKKINFKIKGSENITQIMEMLSATGDFRYTVKDRNIILWNR